MSEEWITDPDYERVHAQRYALSREWLKPAIGGALRKIIELGALSSFGRALHNAGHEVRTTGDYDLAERNVAFGQLREWADLVLCMEVIEHVHDQPRSPATEWLGTGTRQMLASAFDMLRPGGQIFLTTPNTCSLNAIEKALHMEPPFVYRPHTREYAPREIAEMIRGAGFNVVRFETENPWSGNNAYPNARRLVDALGYSSPHRGECIFVLAQRPI